MKITYRDFKTILYAVYRAQQGMETLREYKQKGLTPKRWRWDLLWRAERLGFLPDRFVLDTLYSYVDDDQPASMAPMIVRPLNANTTRSPASRLAICIGELLSPNTPASAAMHSGTA